MNLGQFVEEISRLKKDSETLAEIKRIMHNDRTIDIVEQITHLQKNTQVNNFNVLRDRLDSIADKIDEINGEFSGNFSEVEDAIRSLESVTEYSDYVDDSLTAISELKEELEALAPVNELEEEYNNGVADGLEMDSETNEQKSSNYTQQ
jgi:vacuolar-type H+-ATPase subunit I/STV1